MAFVGIAICWFTAAAHSLFRSADPIVIVPYLVVFPLLLLMPWFLYRVSPWLRSRVTPEWIRQMEQAEVMALLINIPGVLFFHVKYPQFQYDRFLHVAGVFVGVWWQSLVAAPFLFAGSRRRLLTVLGISIFISLFAWEGYQWLQDRLFGSHTFYDYYQPVAVDFWEDIAFGALGMVIGLWNLSRKFPQYLSFRRPAAERLLDAAVMSTTLG